jgi:hypothetical protein
VPITTDKSIFEKYAKQGQKLIDLHLLKKDALHVAEGSRVGARNDGIIPIKVNGDIEENFIIDKIDKIVYENEILYLHTTDNKKITFEGITEEIYNFEIGSYKPIDKWLKYRKKDSVLLTSKDLQHIKEMAIAIKETINIMGEIEELDENYLK